ncbi:hypothetical protein B0J17DRAFT_643709 [Rhizoctonia solani]|nr:hypothetical protein B0J17DRAFT_643709 [Rhizoctonia solani]
MSENTPTREPKRVPSRDPVTIAPPIVLATVITVFSLSVLFLVYRRASSWKSVIQHRYPSIHLYYYSYLIILSDDRLRTWSVREGAIRLPDDEAEHVPINPSHHTDAQTRSIPAEP